MRSFLTLLWLAAAIAACGDDDSAAARTNDGGAPRDAATARPTDTRAPDARVVEQTEPPPATVIAMDAGDADAAQSDSATADSGDTGPPAHAVSKYCGDAIRDPVREECDDGPGTGDDVCSADCRVRSIPLLMDGDEDGDAGMPEVVRTFGTGPHVAAAGELGFSVVYVESTGANLQVWLQSFDELGSRAAPPLEVSRGSMPAGTPSPVIAALPEGRYALAVTDSSSGTPDVMLRVVDADGELGDPRLAHASTAGFQQDPDLLWTGSELIVAFTELLDVKYRRFDARLEPLGDDRYLGSSSAIESSVTLAGFGTGWAAAFRSNLDALERIEVVSADDSWRTPAALPGPAGDRPALIALDDDHLLLLFTIGTDPLDTGNANVGRLRAAVLSRSAPGEVAVSEFSPLLGPYANDSTLSQRRPNATRVADRVYVAWENAGPPGYPNGVEAFIARVELDPIDGILVQHAELPLPPTLPHAGDEENPRIAASPLFPEGALISVWESNDEQFRVPAPGLALDLRPSPFVTLPATQQ